MSDETQHIFQEEAPLILSIQLIVFLLKIDRWNYLFTTWAKPNLIYDDNNQNLFFYYSWLIWSLFTAVVWTKLCLANNKITWLVEVIFFSEQLLKNSSFKELKVFSSAVVMSWFLFYFFTVAVLAHYGAVGANDPAVTVPANSDTEWTPTRTHSLWTSGTIWPAG